MTNQKRIVPIRLETGEVQDFEFDYDPSALTPEEQTAADILKKPLIADVILVGLTDEQGIREMKEEGFVPLGWDGDAVIEELHHGNTKEDRQAGGSEDEAQG